MLSTRLCRRCFETKPLDLMVQNKHFCKACKAERQREIWAADPEKALASDRAKRDRHLTPEQIANRDRRKETRDRVKALVEVAISQGLGREAAARRARYLDNPGPEIASSMKRQTKRYTATPPWANMSAIYAIYKDAQARRASGEDVEVDHEIPLQGKLVSGLHVESNLRIRSRKFNRDKRAKFDVTEDWHLVNGRLVEIL